MAEEVRPDTCFLSCSAQNNIIMEYLFKIMLDEIARLRTACL
jgi:hypothetical protein